MKTDAELRPSKQFKTKLNLYVWLGFLVFVFPWVFFGFDPDLGWVYVWSFLGGNALWMVPLLVWIPLYCDSIKYELGDEEIVVHKGVVTRVTKTIPYRTITNIAVKRGPLDRWLGIGGIALHTGLGIGGIALHTAGYSQQGGPEATLVGLEAYDDVHQMIFAALRRYRARADQAVGTEERPEGSESVGVLLEKILGELRALRRTLEDDAKD